MLEYVTYASKNTRFICRLRVCALFAMLFIASMVMRAYSSEKVELYPDSANFLKASVLISDPGNRFYSNLGHVAIRMECPVHNLDYCFSFMIDDDTRSIIRFFSGESEGRIIAVETPDYLEEYAAEGRGVEQYELNLTLHEMQHLWMLLDNDIVAPENRKFNYIINNCTSSAIISIYDCLLEGDTLHYVWPEPAIDIVNAKGVRYITRNNPWMQLLCMLLIGTEGEVEWDNTYRMSPELLVPLLESSTVVNGGESRPLLNGERITLVENTSTLYTPWLTPNLLFGITAVRRNSTTK